MTIFCFKLIFCSKCWKSAQMKAGDKAKERFPVICFSLQLECSWVMHLCRKSARNKRNVYLGGLASALLERFFLKALQAALTRRFRVTSPFSAGASHCFLPVTAIQGPVAVNLFTQPLRLPANLLFSLLNSCLPLLCM